MATASGHVKEHRDLVPISRFIESTSPNGVLMVMNVFIDSAKVDEYIKIATPVVKKMRANAECLFCEVSVNPQDKGHIRVVHGWTKDSAWFRDNMETQPWFGEYVKAIAGMADPNRQRIIEHFDRIIID
ncbi:hypothetical protein LTR67_007174 [Exophiala xenobiotica]